MTETKKEFIIQETKKELITQYTKNEFTSEELKNYSIMYTCPCQSRAGAFHCTFKTSDKAELVKHLKKPYSGVGHSNPYDDDYINKELRYYITLEQALDEKNDEKKIKLVNEFLQTCFAHGFDTYGIEDCINIIGYSNCKIYDYTILQYIIFDKYDRSPITESIIYICLKKGANVNEITENKSEYKLLSPMLLSVKLQKSEMCKILIKYKPDFKKKYIIPAWYEEENKPFTLIEIAYDILKREEFAGQFDKEVGDKLKYAREIVLMLETAMNEN